MGVVDKRGQDLEACQELPEGLFNPPFGLMAILHHHRGHEVSPALEGQKP